MYIQSNTMETISLKMEKSMLDTIDASLCKHLYATRTEFIRDSIRRRLTQLEKEEIFRKLDAIKGSLKGKAKMSDEEARRLVSQEYIKKFNLDV
jgi:Arc/MetJ-type ribon-helix-helix transcriptional regulator